MYHSYKPFRKQTVQLQTIAKIKPFYNHLHIYFCLDLYFFYDFESPSTILSFQPVETLKHF